MSPLLQAENEYRAAMKKAAKEAEYYESERKREQGDYIAGLNDEWHSFENAEIERLAKIIAEKERALESETADLKKRLQGDQQKKAGLISDRLKKEVFSAIWQ